VASDYHSPAQLLGYFDRFLEQQEVRAPRVTREIAEELTVEDLDETLVLAFLDHLEAVRGCSARTRNARLAAIRAFFAFLAREDPALLPQCQTIRAIPLKRTAHKTMTYLEEDETQAVLNAVGRTARMRLRDQALLLMLYNSGARVSEIVSLRAACR
jgi:site-specific recombinase XerD